ncbi:hypothetical protein CAPTEDRAFT_219982 [Capitella teleta]|uniref:Transposable element P transposase-like RNase H domain-containing protein n=1 Tax=Capitella teleta TaxID=283909 RepID=R7TZJ9_CAPTE|nr:hypothetical protein CAPTEDRAFT_219982 [Capitella teleta]|eukprot:ELT96340.1 hypothetical protein CAPTEDRAFT_219982 [Capitella teleta]
MMQLSDNDRDASLHNQSTVSIITEPNTVPFTAEEKKSLDARSAGETTDRANCHQTAGGATKPGKPSQPSFVPEPPLLNTAEEFDAFCLTLFEKEPKSEFLQQCIFHYGARDVGVVVKKMLKAIMTDKLQLQYSRKGVVLFYSCPEEILLRYRPGEATRWNGTTTPRPSNSASQSSSTVRPPTSSCVPLVSSSPIQERPARNVLQEAGFCPKLEKMISLRAQGLAPHERLVSVLFDGMRLTQCLRYSKDSDVIVGFEDVRFLGRSNNIANEGVVIMMLGHKQLPRCVSTGAYHHRSSAVANLCWHGGCGYGDGPGEHLMEDLWLKDSQKPTRLPRGKKMKVCLAAQIFSHSASAAMKTFIKLGIIPHKATGTAIFLQLQKSQLSPLGTGNTSSTFEEAMAKPLSVIEEQTSTYIAGSAVRHLMNTKSTCRDCIKACVSATAPKMVFSVHKDVQGDCLKCCASLEVNLPII